MSTSTSTTTPASPSSTGLDIARLLVQKVSRAFYGTKGAILIDQLIQKEA
jgi:transcription initiation factor TFIIE subunit alpha